MSRPGRVMVRTGIALAVIMLLCVCAALWYVHAVKPKIDGEIRVSGLTAPVQVFRDSIGVPSIWAQNEHDMLFAQGYVHAQDRLWQMDLMRHVGEGRVSELFGEKGVETDRFLRAFGVPRAAAAQEAALDEISRKRITAYVDGVNAFIAELHVLPPEYAVLRIRPGPWTIRQTLAVEKVMALDLSQYFLARDRTRSAQTLGAARAEILQPPYPPWGPLIVEDSSLDMMSAVLQHDSRKATPTALAPPAVPALAASLIAYGSVTHASNAWVISGSRTRSHKPILANDMHLELGAPPVWYLIGLHSDRVDCVGMSIPGSPFIVAGHNRAIAWGLTNAMLDDSDLFIERPDPVDPTRYMTPDGSAAFVNVVDTIIVKGRRKPEILRYRMTRHGPVISDVEKGITNGRDVIALQWAGADASRTMRGMPDLMQATDWPSFLVGVTQFDDPHQNVVYADTAGHIGYQMGGRIPQRSGLNRLPPSLPVPGWTGEWDWHGYSTITTQPMLADPARGYIVTANNRQMAGSMADQISDGWETPFRAARIREMILAAKQPLTADDVHLMQLDVHDATVERYRDRAINAARAAGAEPTAALLEKWDGNATRNSTAATIFYLFYDRLRNRLVQSLYGDSIGWMDRPIVDDVLEHRRVPWTQPGQTAASAISYDTLAMLAMKDAIAIAHGRTWGAIHHITAVHPLAVVAILQRILHLNIGDVPGDGASTTVNASMYNHLRTNGGSTSFAGTVGPSQRHVVDMGDIDGSGGFILPGGESGLPFSTTYRDQFARWLNGGLSTIPLAKQTSAARSVHTLMLIPGDSVSFQSKRVR